MDNEKELHPTEGQGTTAPTDGVAGGSGVPGSVELDHLLNVFADAKGGGAVPPMASPRTIYETGWFDRVFWNEGNPYDADEWYGFAYGDRLGSYHKGIGDYYSGIFLNPQILDGADTLWGKFESSMATVVTKGLGDPNFGSDSYQGASLSRLSARLKDYHTFFDGRYDELWELYQKVKPGNDSFEGATAEALAEHLKMKALELKSVADYLDPVEKAVAAAVKAVDPTFSDPVVKAYNAWAADPDRSPRRIVRTWWENNRESVTKDSGGVIKIGGRSTDDVNAWREIEQEMKDLWWDKLKPLHKAVLENIVPLSTSYSNASKDILPYTPINTQKPGPDGPGDGPGGGGDIDDILDEIFGGGDDDGDKGGGGGDEDIDDIFKDLFGDGDGDGTGGDGTGGDGGGGGGGNGGDKSADDILKELFGDGGPDNKGTIEMGPGDGGGGSGTGDGPGGGQDLGVSGDKVHLSGGPGGGSGDQVPGGGSFDMSGGPGDGPGGGAPFVPPPVGGGPLTGGGSGPGNRNRDQNGNPLPGGSLDDPWGGGKDGLGPDDVLGRGDHLTSSSDGTGTDLPSGSVDLPAPPERTGVESGPDGGPLEESLEERSPTGGSIDMSDLPDRERLGGPDELVSSGGDERTGGSFDLPGSDRTGGSDDIWSSTGGDERSGGSFDLPGLGRPDGLGDFRSSTEDRFSPSPGGSFGSSDLGGGRSSGGSGSFDMSDLSGSGSGTGLGSEQGSGLGSGLGSGGQGAPGGQGAAGPNGQAGPGGPMMPPMMPPMGGMGAGAGAGAGNQERNRSTWLTEDEKVWGTSASGGPAVLGRPGAGPGKGASGVGHVPAGADGSGTRTASGDAAQPLGGKRKPGVGHRRGRVQGPDGQREGERQRRDR
ncbi:hypothetical protein [Nocardiopsis potens]|uniref:hypothetical protein n=1 Tax=Nocardiopsis potens TaxID=1246458 RepID=UPI00034B9810|nr:hypothetical protein [Nocardiopsis potens]